MQKFILGIGAPRSGTTWIYSNLRMASDVYMPPVKELRYFFGKRSAEERAIAAKKLQEVSSKDPFDKDFISAWINTLDGDTEAYTSLFPKTGSIGEISPIYSVMSRKYVALVKAILAPYDAKVFYIMRSPLRRDLSHIIFSLHRQASISEPRPAEVYKDFIDRPAFKRRSNYRRTISHWRAEFKTDFNKYYYDDLEARPKVFWERFCSELGLEADQGAFDKRPKNKSGSDSRFADITIPKSITLALRERHLETVPKMKFLPKRISEKWMSELESYDGS